eukprot:g54925.t1
MTVDFRWRRFWVLRAVGLVFVAHHQLDRYEGKGLTPWKRAVTLSFTMVPLLRHCSQSSTRHNTLSCQPNWSLIMPSLPTPLTGGPTRHVGACEHARQARVVLGIEPQHSARYSDAPRLQIVHHLCGDETVLNSPSCMCNMVKRL